MEKSKKIFIACRIKTYGKTAAYIFVDFLTNRAGSSN